MAPMPSLRHTVPCGRMSCPAVTERLKVFPSMWGALQRLRVRAQSQTQAAFGLSGSISFLFHSCQPQEKTEPRPSSFAMRFAESPSHLTTWYQAEAGTRPFRPPTPFWLRKLIMIPSRFDGMPSEARSTTAFR